MDRSEGVRRVFKLLKKGFTLIELLVTIAIVAVISAAVLVAISPAEKIRQANDSRVQSDVGQIATSLSTYATLHNGSYPLALADLVTANEITAIPVPPTGTSAAGVTYLAAYGYTAETAAAGACTTAAETCTRARVWNRLTAANAAANSFWMFCTSNGRTGVTTGSTQALCP